MNPLTNPSPAELPKTYDPAHVEPQATAAWNEQRVFHAEPGNSGEPFAIVIPPPNVTAALHLGHALNNTLQDILTRQHRMMGDNSIWLPGTDHAGIATQTVVEKRVLKEEGMRRTQFSREAFVAKIQAWKDEYEAKITQQLKAMGCSCDWERQAFTMDPPRAQAVREAFFRLFKDGLIYRGKRLVNWDPATQTALADDEVEMEEVDGHFYYLRYPLTDRSGYVTVATTRPETMLGDTAVAINPKDPRAEQLRGKKVRLPLVNREIPIIEDDYVVLPVSMGGDPADPKAQFATGFLKVTPAHDPNDWDLGQRHKLEVINVMAPDASISNQHGWHDVGEAEFLLGKSREEARKLIVQWFKENGLLEEVKPYKHSVGHSYRSHVPIEPYLSDQWYCKVTDPRLAGAALAAMDPAQRTESDEGRSRDLEGAVSTPTELEEGRSRDREGAVSDTALKDSGYDRFPLAYLITFTTYGNWLHGDQRGSADREHNVFGRPYLIGDEARERHEFTQLKHPPLSLIEVQRKVVQDTIAEVCRQRQWTLHVAHVRPTHVHVVLSADAAPEKVLNDLKSYATRRLREQGLVGTEENVWTHHGSTRYLFTDEALLAASEYVYDRQGESINPLPVTGADVGTLSAEKEPLPHGRGSFSSQRRLRFHPARYAKTFQSWHENIRDWCISRQLWWGHRIPVWHRTGVPRSADAEQEQLTKWAQEGRVAIQKLGHYTDQLEVSGWDDPNGAGNMVTQFICVGPNNDPLESWLNDKKFTQDPDVLDTWFSSALWPLSTLNWPSDTPELAKWNPSSVLCTAREIITLWVSRMVMFNLYFRDCLPFKDVFIHAMIQDGEGRKMSKSLGNGVDPLDIIDSHGADAMRFTLANMATTTQDVRMPVERDATSGKNTSPKFDIGRNFCNKLWNAARFTLSNIQSVSPEPADETRWSMADRWIVSRFNRTVADVNAALAEYRFDQYAKLCYDFFWRDFCDWYLEAIKPAMRDPQRASQTATVLAALLDGSLRLMHPMIPFITEFVFWKLNEIRPERGLPNRLECPPNAYLASAAWPKVGEFAEAAEYIFPKLQEIIGAVRTIRNDYQVEPKRSVTVSISAPGDSARQIQVNQEILETLATCTLKEVRADLPPVANAARAQAAGCEIFVEGLVDAAAQEQRNAKRREELTKQVSTLKGRLSNEAYIKKAPPHLVEQTQSQLAQAEAELQKLS